jgi:hypothetical protein
MPSKIELPPPPPIFPTEDDGGIDISKLPAGSREWEKRPLRLTYIEDDDKDLMSMVINIMSAVTLFTIMALVIYIKIRIGLIAIAVPAIVVWCIYVNMEENLFVDVPARKGKLYLDRLTGRNIVYGPGGHFVAWYYRAEPDEINFQVHEVIEANKKDGTEIVFPTLNGKLKLFLNFKLLFCRVQDEEALSHSLNYTIDEIKGIKLARIARRLSDLGGRNTFETLLYHKSAVMDWVSSIFADEFIRTAFEIKMGTEVSSMQATELDATDDSRAILDSRAKGDMIDELTAKFIAQGATPADALLAAQTTVGTVKREHYSTGDNVTSLWVGNDINPRTGGK